MKKQRRKILIITLSVLIIGVMSLFIMLYSFYSGMRESDKKYFQSELIEKEIQGVVLKYYKSRFDSNVFKIRYNDTNGDSYGLDLCGEQVEKITSINIMKGDSLYKDKFWDYILVYTEDDTLKLFLNYCN